jgi:DNA-binding transcriptional LysR family regulator
VEVVVRNQPSADTVAMLRAGELEFGLRALTSVPADLDYRPILPFDRMLIAKPRHLLLRARRLTVEALASHPFVMPWAQSNTRRLVDAEFATKGLACRVALEGGSWEVIKRYVALGVGIAVVPACCITREDRNAIGARSVRALFGQDVYGVLLRQGRALPRAAQDLLRLLETARRRNP